jgi:Leucine-rich repeat (LRR) protein
MAGGFVYRSKSLPGRPVVRVLLCGTLGTDALVRHLVALPNLRYLILHETDISKDGLDGLRDAEKLAELNIEGQRVDDGSLKAVGQIKSLEHCQFLGCEVTSSGWASLASESLKSLVIFRCRSKEGALKLLGIGELGTLRSLCIFGVDLAEGALKDLSALRKLETLDISRVGIKDEDLAPVGSMENLRSLTLQGGGINDKALRGLRWPRKLEYLDLAGTDITDLGLRDIRGLASLRKLDIRHTRVGQEAARELRTTLPKARIVTDGGDESTQPADLEGSDDEELDGPPPTVRATR